MFSLASALGQFLILDFLKRMTIEACRHLERVKNNAFPKHRKS